MQLSQTTDYAIRIVLYMAQKGGVISSKELAEHLAIPKNYVPQITKRLSNAKLIKMIQGVYGGTTLCRDAKEISLWDIVSEMESTMNINRCLEHDKYCSRFATENCPVHEFYCQLQSTLEKELKQMTISELLILKERN